MRQIITADFGRVKLGDVELPGVFTQIRIKGALRLDQVFVPGSSGKARQPMGFEPAKVSLTIRLPNDRKSTPYEKLAQLTALFQSVDEAAKPRVYRLINKHTEAWRIRDVIYAELTTSEDNQSDTILAELEFEEYLPVVVRAEARAQQADELGGAEDAFASSAEASDEGTSKPVGAAAADDDEV
ncbi:MAG: hypothetical protein ACOX44_07935 [Limnochordia bacterium]